MILFNTYSLTLGTSSKDKNLTLFAVKVFPNQKHFTYRESDVLLCHSSVIDERTRKLSTCASPGVQQASSTLTSVVTAFAKVSVGPTAFHFLDKILARCDLLPLCFCFRVGKFLGIDIVVSFFGITFLICVK